MAKNRGRKNSKRRKRGKGPQHRPQRRQPEATVDEQALRLGIRRLLASGSPPTEVYGLVFRKVSEVAQQAVKGKSKVAAAAAHRDVREKLLTIATEELLDAGYSQDELEAEVEAFRRSQKAEGNPMDEPVREFIATELARGSTPDQIANALVEGGKDIPRHKRKSGESRLREIIQEEVDARLKMVDSLKAELRQGLDEDEPIPLRVHGVGPYKGGEVPADHPGFSMAMDEALAPLTSVERGVFMEMIINHVRMHKAQGKPTPIVDINEMVEKTLASRASSELINDFVRVQLLKGVDPKEIERQVEERWGSIAESTNWRHTAYEKIREVIQNAPAEQVQAILDGARAQSPEAHRYIQEIVGDRVMDEATTVGAKTESHQILDEISAGMTKPQLAAFSQRLQEETANAPGQTLDVDRIREIADSVKGEDRAILQELEDHGLTNFGGDRMTAERLMATLRSLHPDERPEFYEELNEYVNGPKRGQHVNLDDIVARIRAGFGKSEPMILEHEPKSRSTPQEQTVENYMEATAQAYGLTKRQRNSLRQRQDAIFIWRCLRDARVFHFDTDTYVGLYQEIDRYVTEELAGFTYYPPGKYIPDLPEEEIRAVSQTILRESKNAAYPDKFPFECVFLGYGFGVQMNEDRAMASAPQALRDSLEVAGLLGHLMTDDGSVYAVVKGIARLENGGRTGVLWFEALRTPGGGWVRSDYNLEPWILPSLIRIINDHRTFVLENAMGRDLRRDYKRNRKGMGLKPNKRAYTPPPYYTLKLKSKIVRDKVRKGLPRPAAPKTYRTDVRAHERCRVARGPLPLDPEVGAKLRKRGYTIFTTNALDVETYRRLHERGLPYKKADEWLAILVSWVEEHFTSNDESLPYIPAVRVPGEVRLKPKQAPTGSWVDDPAS